MGEVILGGFCDTIVGKRADFVVNALISSKTENL